MKIKLISALLIVLVLCFTPYIGTDILGFKMVFGIIIPYIAFLVFIMGIIWKVLYWARSPVPFRITTTCGQQKSLPWIKANGIDNPFSKTAVAIRMALEILAFRSLFRNTLMSVQETSKGKKIVYKLEVFLWIAALAFHYSFLVVFIRHLRFFMKPVPKLIQFLENIDGFFQIEYMAGVFAVGLPGVLISGIILFAALFFLLGRRILSPLNRYISNAGDYFPLLLIIAIAFTGILMRYFTKVDITGVKELTLGFASFKPVIPETVGSIFYIHFFLVCVLFAYIPFSKISHMGGVFLSPARNLTADTRRKRHINPWNPDVKTHTYKEYEEEFRDKMIGAGIPVEEKEKING
ncbi:MAG: sulfate reduction electron transfer complex DsrMKJOP subunit DsrM [bacterium]